MSLPAQSAACHRLRGGLRSSIHLDPRGMVKDPRPGPGRPSILSGRHHRGQHRQVISRDRRQLHILNKDNHHRRQDPYPNHNNRPDPYQLSAESVGPLSGISPNMTLIIATGVWNIKAGRAQACTGRNHNHSHDHNHNHNHNRQHHAIHLHRHPRLHR